MKYIRLILLSVFWALYAQTDHKIQLQFKDAQTEEPLAGVQYRYGNKAGAASEEGVIHLTVQSSDTLFLSHIRYGEWFVTAGELERLPARAVLYREEKALRMAPVTVIAVRHRPDKNAHMQLNVQEQLAHDAGAVLNRIPAINGIRKSGGYGFDPVMRGFKYDRLNIVIDGAQTATAACPNRMDPPTSQITPNMMRSVEVLKGPHSFRYGDSFGGAINFKSLPLRMDDKGFYGRWSGSGESNGQILRTEGVAGWRGSWYDIGLLGSWSKGNDYIDGSGVSIPAAFARGSYGLNAGFKTDDRNTLRISLSRNEAGLTQFPSLPMDLASDKTTLFNMRHIHKGDGGALYQWRSSVYATHVDHQMNNLHKELDPRMLNAATTAQTYSLGGRTEGTWVWESFKLFGGADFRLEQADGTRDRSFIMGPMAGKTVHDNVWNGGRLMKGGLFAELHQFLPHGKLIYSGRLEWNHARATNPDDGFLSKTGYTEQTRINPNFSIGGITRWQRFTAGLWLGRAQRSAGLSERFINSFPIGLDPYDMLGTPNLKPEANNEADLTLGYGTDNFQMKVNLYASYLTDYISSEIDTTLSPTMPSSPGVRRYTNIDAAMTTGFELDMEYHWRYNVRQRLNMAYTYGKNLALNEPLPEIAPLDIRYELRVPAFGKRLQTALTVRHVSQQDRISRRYGETVTPSFTTVDSRLSWQFIQGVTLSLTAANMFDVAYYEHLSRNMKGSGRPLYAPGRNFILSVTFNRL
ncbi:MAG: TonB-dependent receptor [Calditrichaeota bacterium]|nr:MAG: TonB-dependent receptor [Calditrichota bacterium]